MESAFFERQVQVAVARPSALGRDTDRFTLGWHSIRVRHKFQKRLMCDDRMDLASGEREKCDRADDVVDGVFQRFNRLCSVPTFAWNNWIGKSDVFFSTNFPSMSGPTFLTYFRLMAICPVNQVYHPKNGIKKTLFLPMNRGILPIVLCHGSAWMSPCLQCDRGMRNSRNTDDHVVY